MHSTMFIGDDVYRFNFDISCGVFFVVASAMLDENTIAAIDFVHSIFSAADFYLLIRDWTSRACRVARPL